jgi:hypothetical protein
MCVVQYPLGRVFVSAPDPSQDVTGGRDMKRTKNIQKKSLPALRGEEQRLVIIVGIAGAHRSICNDIAKRWLTRVVRIFKKSRIYGGCRDSRCLAGLKRRNSMNPRAKRWGQMPRHLQCGSRYGTEDSFCKRSRRTRCKRTRTKNNSLGRGEALPAGT